MKTASGGLIALLAAGGPFLMVDLYTLTLLGGTTYRWAGSDTDISLGGNTFLAAVDQGSYPLIERGEIRQARGLEVSTLDITLHTGDTALILGVDASLAAHNGALDGARVKVERVIMPTWGDTSNGSLVLFEGMVAGVEPGSTNCVLHINSDLQLLQIQMPRTLFTPACANAFGDSSCGINIATLTVAKTTGVGSTVSVIYGASGPADQYYQNGLVNYTSGANTGTTRAVTSFVGGVLTLVTPLAFPPATGDTFTVSPGCARTTAACAGFSNSTRFRGCPFIPFPETTR